MFNELLKLLIQILISGGAALLGARLAAKRFREDRWWESQMKAYSELVEALHKMKWPAKENLDAYDEKRKIPVEKNNEYWKEFEVAHRKVLQVAESSSFILSYKVMDAVREMENDLSVAGSCDDVEDYLNLHFAAVEGCLLDIKRIGSEELGFHQKRMFSKAKMF